MSEKWVGYPPTFIKYKDVFFASKMLAQWACFFDSLGIGWSYREEEFAVGGKFGDKLEDDELVFIPDFRLFYGSGEERIPTSLYVEVYAATKKIDPDELETLHDWGGVLPNFADSEDDDERGLLLLGPIYESYSRSHVAHPIIQHREGLLRNYFTFAAAPYRQGLMSPVLLLTEEAKQHCLSVQGVWHRDSEEKRFWSSEPVRSFHSRPDRQVARAYAEAFSKDFSSKKK